MSDAELNAMNDDGRLTESETAASKLIDIKELAELLGVSTRTLERSDVDGRIPRPVLIGTRLKRWHLVEINAWRSAGCPDRLTWEARKKAEIEAAAIAPSPAASSDSPAPLGSAAPSDPATPAASPAPPASTRSNKSILERLGHGPRPPRKSIAERLGQGATACGGVAVDVDESSADLQGQIEQLRREADCTFPSRAARLRETANRLAEKLVERDRHDCDEGSAGGDADEGQESPRQVFQ